MKVIFGTTNKRKIEDLQNLVNTLKLNIEIISLEDINWDREKIEENGHTVEENSLIKANAVYDFCKKHEINYTIITDDTGLFCEALENEPGIYTARYADDELAKDPSLPKYQCVIKLLKNLEFADNRKAKYKCAITCMMANGSYYQEIGETNGTIAKSIIGELKRPYFYSIFIPEGFDKAFNKLSKDELQEMYRYKALKKVLEKLNLK